MADYDLFFCVNQYRNTIYRFAKPHKFRHAFGITLLAGGQRLASSLEFSGIEEAPSGTFQRRLDASSTANRGVEDEPHLLLPSVSDLLRTASSPVFSVGARNLRRPVMCRLVRRHRSVRGPSLNTLHDSRTAHLAPRLRGKVCFSLNRPWIFSRGRTG